MDLRQAVNAQCETTHLYTKATGCVNQNGKPNPQSPETISVHINN